MDFVVKPQNANNIGKANKYFEDRYRTSLAQNDTLNMAHSLYYLSSIEFKKGGLDESEKRAVNALELLNSFKKRRDYTNTLKKSIFNILGIVYRKKRSKLRAIDLYKSSFELAETAKDSATILNNISNVYEEHNELSNSAAELTKARKMIPRIKDTLTRALILDNLGVIYSKLGYHSKGLDLIDEALNLRKHVRDSSTIYTSLASLSKHYNRINDKVGARKHALQALNIADRLNLPAYRLNALKLLTAASHDEYAAEYEKLKDSLDFINDVSNSEWALLDYEYVENKRLTAENKLKISEERNMKLFYLLIAIIVTSISIIIFFAQRVKHRKEKLHEVYKTETRISRKVHDEVANDLYNVMTKIQGKVSEPEMVLDDLDQIYTKTRDISKENSTLEVNENFDELLKDLLLSYNDEKVNVFSKGLSSINWPNISVFKKTAIYRVLQELMTNMRKHSEASVAVISFSSSNRKTIIDYKDNGKGCEIKKASGLSNTETRISSVNGTIIFDSKPNKGFHAKIIV